MLKGKVALITGASSGIGRATAFAMAREDARVALAGRNLDDLSTLVREIDGTGIHAMAVKGDVTVEEDRSRMITETVRTFGALDILVNSAGVIATGTIENTTLPSWREMMEINVEAVFRLMQLALPHLESRKGNVVNVSSVNGIRAFSGVLAYCVSKAALEQLTRCSALELASKGIRVNNVNPGVVETSLHRRAGMEEERYRAFLEHSKTTHPLGRVGRPEDIAELIVFLASEKAGWVTGASYSIDGGRHQTCLR